MKGPHELPNVAGMTMIEMIGVLGVIAVLGALIIPRVFDVVTQSKVESLMTATQTYETAVTKYYTNVGTVLPLNPSGIPAVEECVEQVISAINVVSIKSSGVGDKSLAKVPRSLSGTI